MTKAFISYRIGNCAKLHAASTEQHAASEEERAFLTYTKLHKAARKAVSKKRTRLREMTFVFLRTQKYETANLPAFGASEETLREWAR